MHWLCDVCLPPKCTSATRTVHKPWVWPLLTHQHVALSLCGHAHSCNYETPSSLLRTPQVKWLAFEDVVDWDTIALVVHREKMADIPALVAATDVEV